MIAFCLGTTVLLKMGHRWAVAVTLLPLFFVTAATFSAGWMKIASPDARLGFLAAAADLQSKASAGMFSPERLKQIPALIFNARLDAAVTGGFLLLVAAILLGSFRVWWQLLRGTRSAELKEEAPVLLNPPAGVELTR